ncbi:hypothetical protein TWF788_003957 [Orbilia oligospora]|uniref:J domain-containing protein n=1 Tax=Orbilia oligospora TaxID=2813651 RepID=A0A7C8KBE6_ORBOL|nr:hypothetical protein TWF788_003957 [Orbilia oligospora]
MKNYYEILGVPETASPDESRRAWKRRALEIHPDRNVGDLGATGAFQKLQEAYECLVDPRKRGDYDRRARPAATAAASARKTSRGGGVPFTASEPGLSPEEESFRRRWWVHEIMRPQMPRERELILFFTRKLDRLRQRVAQYEAKIESWEERRRKNAWSLFSERKRAGGQMFPTKLEDHTRKELDAQKVGRMTEHMADAEEAHRDLTRSQAAVYWWEKDEEEMLKQKKDLEEIMGRGRAARDSAEEEDGRKAATEENRKAAEEENLRRRRRKEEERKKREKEERMGKDENRRKEEEQERKRREEEEKERRKREGEREERRRRYAEAAERRRRGGGG